MSRKVVRGFSASRFREVRERQGFTRAELARLSEVSVGAIRNWEVEDAVPQVDTLYRVVSVLGVAITDVVLVAPEERQLSDLRVLAGLTQPQLAARAELATTTVAGLEQGHVRLQGTHAEQLAKALELPVAVVEDAYMRTHSRPR